MCGWSVACELSELCAWHLRGRSSETMLCHHATSDYSLASHRWSPQPSALASRSQASSSRDGRSIATRRRNDDLGSVWRLSKETTQSCLSPSPRPSRSSDVRPRIVVVRWATTTASIRSATRSRVRTRTGRSPPRPTSANQISPRFTGRTLPSSRCHRVAMLRSAMLPPRLR